MIKILKILGIYLLLTVLSQSCSPEHFLISGIEFNGATVCERNSQREHNSFIKKDILKNDIVFIVSYHYDFIASLDLGFSGKCYAFSKGREIDNYLLENTYSLKFDHPFTFNNVIINANQNLFEIDEIKNQIEIYETNNGFYGMGADKVFEFSPTFKSESVFTTDNYEVTFKCSTSDNRNFEKRIVVKIEN
jgi:hypothetical protein